MFVSLLSYPVVCVSGGGARLTSSDLMDVLLVRNAMFLLDRQSSLMTME
jgi:hypothetical protein